MIVGDRVRLRAVELDDLPRFISWFNDPEVQRGIPLCTPLSTQDEEEWFQENQKRKPEERSLSVDAKVDDEWKHIGSCGFIEVDTRVRSAEIGITIGDKDYWDQGFGSDTLRLLLQHAFDTLNLRRLYLRVYGGNPRAIRVYRNLGFQEEGRMRQAHYHAGQYEDVLIMGLLRDEWSANEEAQG
jgi:diamine N-acetyltransferase